MAAMAAGLLAKCPGERSIAGDALGESLKDEQSSLPLKAA